MSDKTYMVTTETVGGVWQLDSTVYLSLDEAFDGARRVVRSTGTKDGWIEDSNGERVADFEAMKTRCGRD